MQNAYLKKENKLESAVQSSPKEAKNETPILSNSLLLSMQGGNSENEGNLELESTMKSRLAAFRHQIPAAESEADKLSSGITSGTPEQVKQSMGERLGTDLSSVRFHTGESVAQKADNIGARAWTQGNDVYFGEGGFHPTVAAHELVHSAQQGAVDSTAVNVSAPMGEIQMWNPFKCFCGRSSKQQIAPRPLAPKQKKYTKKDMQKIQKQLKKKINDKQGQLLGNHYIDESESNDRDKEPDRGVQQPTRQEQMEQRKKHDQEMQQKMQQIMQQIKQPGQKERDQRQQRMREETQQLARQVVQTQEEEIIFDLMQGLPYLECSQLSGQHSQSGEIRQKIIDMGELLIENQLPQLQQQFMEKLQKIFPQAQQSQLMRNETWLSPLYEEIKSMKSRMLNQAMQALEQRKMAERALVYQNEEEKIDNQTTPAFPKESPTHSEEPSDKMESDSDGNVENKHSGVGSFSDSNWVSRSGNEPFISQNEQIDSKQSGFDSSSNSSRIGHGERETSIHNSDKIAYREIIDMFDQKDEELETVHERSLEESPGKKHEESYKSRQYEELREPSDKRESDSYKKPNRGEGDNDQQIQLAIKLSLLENNKKSYRPADKKLDYIGGMNDDTDTDNEEFKGSDKKGHQISYLKEEYPLQPGQGESYQNNLSDEEFEDPFEHKLNISTHKQETNKMLNNNANNAYKRNVSGGSDSIISNDSLRGNVSGGSDSIASNDSLHGNVSGGNDSIATAPIGSNSIAKTSVGSDKMSLAKFKVKMKPEYQSLLFFKKSRLDRASKRYYQKHRYETKSAAELWIGYMSELSQRCKTSNAKTSEASQRTFDKACDEIKKLDYSLYRQIRDDLFLKGVLIDKEDNFSMGNFNSKRHDKAKQSLKGNVSQDIKKIKKDSQEKAFNEAKKLNLVQRQKIAGELFFNGKINDEQYNILMGYLQPKTLPEEDDEMMKDLFW